MSMDSSPSNASAPVESASKPASTPGLAGSIGWYILASMVAGAITLAALPRVHPWWDPNWLPPDIVETITRNQAPATGELLDRVLAIELQVEQTNNMITFGGIGLVVGALFGLAEGIARRSLPHTLALVLLSAIGGAAGGALGGFACLQVIRSVQWPNVEALERLVLGNCVALGTLGTILGLFLGSVSAGLLVGLRGAFGGLLGGVVAGFLSPFLIGTLILGQKTRVMIPDKPEAQIILVSSMGLFLAFFIAAAAAPRARKS